MVGPRETILRGDGPTPPAGCSAASGGKRANDEEACEQNHHPVREAPPVMHKSFEDPATFF